MSHADNGLVTHVTLLQTHDVSLSMTQLMIIGVCAILAAVSAAAIPSAGLVTMVMVMQVISLALCCLKQLAQEISHASSHTAC